MTTTSREPNWAAANSIEPTTDGATMLPAMRTTKRSPKPSSNRISTGVLESEQPRTMANGRCAASARSRLQGRAWEVPRELWKRRLPATSRAMASCGGSGVGSEEGIGRPLYHFSAGPCSRPKTASGNRARAYGEGVFELDPAACYRALETRDARFDGLFFVGVVTTGVYCRPVCPART